MEIKRTEFQYKIIDQRLLIFAKIKSKEWSQLVENSETIAEKRIEKNKKREAKGKEVFPKTKLQIEKTITNKSNRENTDDMLAKVILAINDLEAMLLSANAKQNQIIANKDATKKQLLGIFIEDSNHREPVFESLVNFHETARVNCTDEEWNKIIKTFTKEMQMSSR